MRQRSAAFVLSSSILGFAGTVSAADPWQEPATFRILVLNQAHVRPEVVRVAEQDVAAIFAAAGVRLEWLDEVSGADKPFDAAIKLAGMTPSMLPNTDVGDLSLGFAALNATGEGMRGHLAWVFFDRVQTHAGRHHVQASRLCGLVMAHEIGHLLLPAGHSDNGLMRATWDLRAGLLEYFTESQVREIHARLALLPLR